jgi:hypothetical protein
LSCSMRCCGRACKGIALMKRLWGIRHVRYYWHAWRMARWYHLWTANGYVGPHQSDLDVLAAIWAGKL